tara:strand:+ start:3570 stop:4574 length:1005 start_codon:yes stop_codon:yes gene_type:complete
MNRPTLALTMGEPAGIGGQLAIKAWHLKFKEGPPFVAIDSINRLSVEVKKLGINIPLKKINYPQEIEKVFSIALPVFDIPLSKLPTPGNPIPETSTAVLKSIDIAVEWALKGIVDGIVTNPIHKETLYKTGFNYPGHTEYLAKLSGASNPPVMMLTCPGLRTVPVTTHLSLRQALDQLTSERIVEQSIIANTAMQNDYAIKSPRLAIAGLNPHAGEAGSMGSEENTIISPAIKLLRNQGINVVGPVSPDTLFTENQRNLYDVAICMYHDQALIPIKTLDFVKGVNVTLGLPIVRTSPDHGTGLDIANTGQANPYSLISALDMAAQIARTRQIEA